MREYRPNTNQRKQMSEDSNRRRPELDEAVSPRGRGQRGLSGSGVLRFRMRPPCDMGSRLSPGLILGLQPRFVGLDKLTKLLSVGEQRVPLLQVESDREATETVDRNTPFLGHFEAEAAALGQATFQLCDPCRHLFRSQVCFIGHCLILAFFSAVLCRLNVKYWEVADAEGATAYSVTRAKSVAKPTTEQRQTPACHSLNRL